VRGLAAGGVQHPPAERVDEAALLGDGDEGGRRDDAALRVAPADQRLEAGQGAVGQGDQRLVVHLQLAALLGLAQVGLQLEALDHLGAHRRLEHRPVVTLGLGAVHRHVGVAQQLVAPAVAAGDADRAAAEDLVAVEGERGPEGGGDALGHGDRVGDVGDVLQQDGELVAAQARGGVRAAQAAPDALGHGHQQRVAGRMAERVVDRLEAVQVDEQHRHLGAAARQGVPEPVDEQRAVGQPRERVVQRLVDHRADGLGVGQGEAGVLGQRDEDLLLGACVGALGAVGAHAQRTDDLALLVHGRGHRRLGALDDVQAVVGHRARGDDVVGRGAAVDEVQRRGRVVEQLGRGADDRVEDAIERRTVRDRALDRAERLQEPLALAQVLQQPGVLQRLLLGAHPQRALVLDDVQQLQRLGQPAGQPAQQRDLRGLVGVAAAGDEQRAVAAVVERDDERRAGRAPGDGHGAAAGGDGGQQLALGHLDARPAVGRRERAVAHERRGLGVQRLGGALDAALGHEVARVQAAERDDELREAFGLPAHAIARAAWE